MGWLVFFAWVGGAINWFESESRSEDFELWKSLILAAIWPTFFGAAMARWAHKTLNDR